MLYNEFMNVASGRCIQHNPDTKLAYIVPDYRYLMRQAGMTPDMVEDDPGFNWEELAETLRLEVEMFNANNNVVNLVADFVRDIIETDVTPIMTQEQNELFKNITEYMKANNLTADDIDKPSAAASSDDVPQKMGTLHYLNTDLKGFSFEKKKP